MAILSCATTEHVQQVGLGAEGTELGALAAVEDHRSVHLGVSGRFGKNWLPWQWNIPQWHPENSTINGDKWDFFEWEAPLLMGKFYYKWGFFEWETPLLIIRE